MWYKLYFKRIFDVVMALAMAVAFSWLFVLIIMLYILTVEYPFIFTQIRIGRGGKFFTLIKFRTLKKSDGSLQGRRFLLGDILRFTSLDELPQLWNVLKGDMSLIGPRPLPSCYLPLFSTEQALRHAVRPGITGWSQLNGRHSIAWEEKFKLDVYYVRSISFMLDVKIVLKTIGLLLSFKRDISLDERPFTG